ncbi:hypothetical protein CC86DRAFT_472688 [Ophiobolus disseminans]|uniref:ABM domain-containing protein n=1 Tax=Ophiobolus disseminans TaxID=1469910 RepID=A0A6A6ZD61_9PLEO|nr:hypothetical protein CC86DRAFT_472688 [Ophiobolus disseminans]
MSGILTTARLVFKDSNARDKAIEAFHNIIAYTTPKEPEVLQYVCALPVDDTSKTVVYMIEEYANQAASDAHLATKPVQDLIHLFTTGDVLAGAPEVHNCSIKHRKTSGSPLSVSSNPAIVLLHTTSSSLENVQSAAEASAKSLNSTLVVEDKETSGVRAEYVFDSWKSYEAFEKTDAAKAILKSAKNVVKIRAIDGFLGREEKSRL